MFQFASLVLRYFRVYLIAPGPDAARQVLYLEAGLLQELRCFLAAAAALAVDYDLAAAIQFADTLLQVAEGNEVATDLGYFEFMGFAYIEQKEIFARISLLLERGHVELLDAVDLGGAGSRRRAGCRRIAHSR